MKQGKLVLLLFFLIFTICAEAQRITNIRFEQFGRDIRVHYTLGRLPYNSFAMLDLRVSTNGGESFSGPLIQVHGDIGKVTSNGAKTIIWQVLDEMTQLSGSIVFEISGEVVKDEINTENLLMYNISGSSYMGVMYGRVARWGGYLRGKTNLSFADAPYKYNDENKFNYMGEDYYVMDKSSRRSRLGITAGALYRPFRMIYLYAGAGYGFRRLMWHAVTHSYDDDTVTGDIWGVHTKRSAEGIEVELGGIYRYKRLAVSAGVNTIGFSFFEVNGAIGFFF